MPMTEKHKGKSRLRLSVLCNECKRRKVKCDRRLPCLTCVKSHTPHRCGYFGNKTVPPNTNLPSDVPGPYVISHENTYSHWQAPPYPASAPHTQKRQHVNATWRPVVANLEGDQNRSRPILEEASSENSENSARLLDLHLLPRPRLALDRSPATVPPLLANSIYTPHAGVPLRGIFHPTESLHLLLLPVHLPVFPGPGPSYNLVNTGGLSRIPVLETSAASFPVISNNTDPHTTHIGPAGPRPSADLVRPGSAVGSCQEPPQNATSTNIEVATLNGPGGDVGVHTGGPAARDHSVPSLLNHEVPPLPPPTWIGKNPHDISEPEEKFDLYGGYNPVYEGPTGSRVSHGPFSWYTYALKDKALTPICLLLNPSPEINLKNKIPSLIRDHEDVQNCTQGSRTPRFSHSLDGLKEDVRKRLLSLGLTSYDGDTSLNISLIDRIRLLLPSKKAVSAYVGRFFEIAYPHLPIVDETYFRKHIQRILGPFTNDDEPYKKLHVTRQYDIANLGVLLLLLRMTYLGALPSWTSANESFPTADSVQSTSSKSHLILTNPINTDVLHCAQLCLDLYSSHHRAHLSVLQCAVMIRTYIYLAPESSDAADGHDEAASNITVIQIATCLGLHRDPSCVENGTLNAAVDHLRRKLWFFIKFLDTRLACHFGSPSMIDDGKHDTKTPFYTPACANVADESLEEAVCGAMQVAAPLIDRARDVLSKCLDLRTPLSVVKLAGLIDELERAVNWEFGALPQLMDGPSDSAIRSYKKVYFTRVYLMLEAFLLAIFYHLFLNYEKKQRFDLSFFYLRKFLTFSCGEFLVQTLNLMEVGGHVQTESYGTGLISPMIAFLIQKTNHINLRLVVQLNCMISAIDGTEDSQTLESQAKLARARKLVRTLSALVKYGNHCLLMLGHRFLYSWKLSKIHSTLLNLATSKSLPQTCAEEVSSFIPLTDHQMNELLQILEKTWLQIRQQSSCEYTRLQKTPPPEQEPDQSQREAVSIQPEVTLRRDNGVHTDLGNNGQLLEESLGFNGGSDSMLSGFAGVDVENIGDIDSLWPTVGSLDDPNTFWQKMESLASEFYDNTGGEGQGLFNHIHTDNGQFWS